MDIGKLATKIAAPLLAVGLTVSPAKAMDIGGLAPSGTYNGTPAYQVAAQTAANALAGEHAPEAYIIITPPAQEGHTGADPQNPHTVALYLEPGVLTREQYAQAQRPYTPPKGQLVADSQ